MSHLNLSELETEKENFKVQIRQITMFGTNFNIWCTKARENDSSSYDYWTSVASRIRRKHTISHRLVEERSSSRSTRKWRLYSTSVHVQI
jgi:hypothetical protein